ncbi:FUSC family protein [Streptomyces albiaxialis]|uniref:FUSC family protein n=1 Tax=Streptomyces albiaxialis TaxID=329523 RepID=UPI0031D05351
MRQPGGLERQTLELIGKSALAASISWYLAHDVMAATSPAFAPFSAVLITQVTAYQSLHQALRYLGAVGLGVFVQAGLGLLAGPDLLTFVLVALIALVIGRWPTLGPQGGQVTTAAFFAFSAYAAASGTAQRLTQLGEILALVGIGCAVALVINLGVWPPVRYRRAEHGIRMLAQALVGLLDDIHPALRDEDWDEERSDNWRKRATALGTTVTHSRSAFATAWESRFYNARRHLPGSTHDQGLDNYQALIDALERVTYQVASMTRTLSKWRREEDGEESRGFLTDYADLLEALARIICRFAEIDGKDLAQQAREACACAETARDKREELVAGARRTELPLSDPSQPYGILLAEATRLMDEAQYACDVLRHVVDGTARHSAGTR